MNNKLININENLKLLNDYPFQRLNNLLKDIKAPIGRKEIILSIGEPKHDPPKFIKNIFNKNYSAWGKYPPTLGMEKLNIASINWLNRRFKLSKNFLDYKENILQLAGTREGLFNVALALSPIKKNKTKPTMLIPEPFYQVYAGACRISGAEPIFVASSKKNGFIPSFANVDKKILMRTSIIYVCSPSNPQGSIASESYWADLLKLAGKFNFRIFADECYSEIYRSEPPPGILEVARKIKANPERIVSFHSLSKRSNVAGLRSGFVTSGPKNIKALKRLRAYAGAPLSLPLQRVSERLWKDEKHVEFNRALYNEKFKIADKIFSNIHSYSSPLGGFFLWLEVKNDEQAAIKLWKQTGIRVLPGSYLSRDTVTGNPGENFIRVALVEKIDQVTRGLNAIREIIYN